MATASELVRSAAVLKEMLTDRGLPAQALDAALSLTHEDATRLLSEAAQAGNAHLTVDVTPHLKAVYVLSAKTKLQDLRSLLKEEDAQRDAQDGGNTEAVTYILIVRDKPNTADLKRLAELGQQQQPRRVEFQLFNIKELQVNISRHVLVPRHELVSDNATIDVLVAQYQLKNKSQFPHILRTDPMARYLDARPGQLVRITRVSPSSGLHVVYRCCV